MNDEEIIKALEQHIERTKNVKYGARKKILVDAELLKNIFDLINRQQAEIEKFKKIETTVNGFWEGIQKLAMFKDKEIPTLEELLEYMDNLKVEAIKEFAKKIRQKISAMVCSPDLLTLDDYDKCIDDVLKEMVGDNDV